jgi:hypothetical protein
LVAALLNLFEDLNLDRLRLVRPTKFVFLCGGIIKESGFSRPDSLRDYLWRVCLLSRRLKGEVVLAEKANQLYRATKYTDLISFEEDIARIASLVLVIAENPGSLAELGAFSSNDVISKSLRVIMQQKYAKAESFVRWGPVERLKNDSDDYVGFFPWRVNSANKLIVRSASPHRGEIIRFINSHIEKAPKTTSYQKGSNSEIFYVIYWRIFLALAISFENLLNCVNYLLPNVARSDLRNKLYCMQLAGWIDRELYSGKDYFFTCYDIDLLEYAYKDGVADRDNARRKLEVTTALGNLENAPRHVRKTASARRGAK